MGTLDRALHNPVGHLYRLQDASLCSVAGGATLANGIGWSPDNRTMYFTDTHTGRIDAFDFDIESGAVRMRWPFVQVEKGVGGPDGLTVDAEGGVWSAQFGRGVIHRYLPDGRLHRVIELPVTQPTSCMFGGSDLRTLYITTARLGLDAAALEAQPWAGRPVGGRHGRTRHRRTAVFLPGAFDELPRKTCDDPIPASSSDA